jgi:hypothetical protein
MRRRDDGLFDRTDEDLATPVALVISVVLLEAAAILATLLL